MGGGLDESSKLGKSTSRKEHFNWQEEKKRWMSAAGVSTPLELELKMESFSRAAAKNSVDLQKLTRHLVEVKAFLVELRELELEAIKRREGRDQLSQTRKRKRSGFMLTLLESSGSTDESSRSREQTTETKGESLLDPRIMKSFGSLTKSSNVQQYRHETFAPK